jgi:hypothetical protein
MVSDVDDDLPSGVVALGYELDGLGDLGQPEP